MTIFHEILMKICGTHRRTVDIEPVLDDMTERHAEKLDWRHSVVDLLKLLDIDSGEENRRDLAIELGYTGDRHDSATMNEWLRKEVMRKLAQNGGRVPDELKH